MLAKLPGEANKKLNEDLEFETNQSLHLLACTVKVSTRSYILSPDVLQSLLELSESTEVEGGPQINSDRMAGQDKLPNTWMV